MTFANSEDSVRLGSPIELYKFTLGTTDYLYTSQEDDVIDGIDVYDAVPLSRSAVAFEGEVNKSNIIITMSRNENIALAYIVQPPQVPVTLYIYRFHDTDDINNKIVIWSGRVIDVSWTNNQVKFNCESIFTSINRFGLTRTYGPTCPFTLYSNNCGVSTISYALTTTIASITGLTLTSDDFALKADNYYSGGYIAYQVAGEPPHYRAINSHISNTIIINYTIPGLVAGAEITAYPGCGHNLEDCTNKFNNLFNYGGFAYNPTLNPFNGTTLF